MKNLLIILFTLFCITSFAQEAGFAGSRDGRVTLENLQKSKKLYVRGMPDWTIVSWDCLIIKGGKAAIFTGTDEFLTPQLLEIVRKMKRNDWFCITNIVAVDANGNASQLASLSIQVF